jgi:hypothetical protein
MVNDEHQNDEKGYANPPDLTPRREGGDDAIAERISSDTAADEKVIDNSGGQENQAGPEKAQKS